MPAADKPKSEAARLKSLANLNVLDSGVEEEFDALVKAAALVCKTPISLISLVDSDRQWFKANVGLPGVTQTSRELAFCAHAIHQDGVLEVDDATKDKRFSDNPLVINDPKIRFYAGATLKLSDGSNVGTFCVIDTKPRQLTKEQLEILKNLATVAVRALEGRRARENEKKLLEEASYIVGMVQQSLDAIISLDLNGVITHWNNAAEKLFGYAAVEMVGTSLDRVMVSDRMHEGASIHSLIRDGVKGLHYETKLLHKNGNFISVSVSLSPNYDSVGKVVGVVSIIRDISDHIQIEKELSEKEARFRALSEVSPLGVFSTDEHGSCTYTNACWQSIFSLNYEESLGQGWAKAIHPLDLESVTSEWQRVTEQGVEFDMEFRVKGRNGLVRYVRARARPLTDNKAKVIGFIGSAEDMTELNGTLKRLSHSEEQIRKLYQSTPAMLQSLDPEGRIISVSDQWLSKHEYSREEVVGHLATEFMTLESAQYADSIVMPDLKRRGCVDDVPYKKVTKSGKVFEVLLSSVLEYDADGNPTRAKCVLKDVTNENAAKRATDELLGTIRSQFIMSITDMKGDIIEVNDAFCMVSQYSREELIGANHRLINSDFHEKSFFKNMWKTIASGKPWRDEVCNKAKDGSLYWVDSVISPLRNADGKVERYISIRSDITKRKAVELLEREQQQRIQQILENQNVATFIIDAAHEVTHWNYACEKLTGVPAKKIVGTSDAWRGFYDKARPCLADLVLDDTKNIAGSYYPKQGQSTLLKSGWHAEAWFENLGGEKRYVIFDAAPITDANGKIVAAIETLQDITDTKLAEQALAAEKQNLDAVIEGTSAGTWQWNISTGALAFNAKWAEMLGYKAEKIGDRVIETWHALVHPDDLNLMLDQQSDHMLSKTDMFEAEFRMRHRRGHWVWILSRGRILTKGEQEDPELMFGTNVDVSDRKKSEMELRRAYANLEEFTAVASHDLKSPLRGIADLMEWVEEDLGDEIPDEVKNNLNRVQLRVKRMGMLIDDLLQYSRAGVASEEDTLLDPIDMVHEIVELQHIPETFKVEVSGKVKPFKTTDTPLKTIIRNLIANAVKHHDKDGGKIDVKVKTRGEYYVFEVKDDGPGIPDTVQERVFKLFQTLSKDKEASGVGLAVSKRMAEVHGGRLELASDVEKRVTMFTLFWPKVVHAELATYE